MQETLLKTSLANAMRRTSMVAPEDYFVVVQQGPHKGLNVHFSDERMHVGRAEWCDVSLPKDPRISRHHCEFQVTSQGIAVRDLGSSNGIQLSGHRVFHARLEPGDVLQIGDSVLILQSRKKPTSLKLHSVDPSGRLVGESDSMRSIFSILARLSKHELPTLFSGETGTGKSSMARALHEQSLRAQGPFVHVNCGALSPSLVEAELFGYEKGAFTGATKQHRGYFEQAHGGTLFLDEIGELPLVLQPKLLDVLERKLVRRLGSDTEIPVDFRLLTATHKNLTQAVAERKFREDLFYRLAVVDVHVPALRERRDDVPSLVSHLLQNLSPGQPIHVAPDVLKTLQSSLWPGNVRQLHNLLQRCLMFVEEDHRLDSTVLEKAQALKDTSKVTVLRVSDASDGSSIVVPPARDEEGNHYSLQERMEWVEREILQQTLDEVGGNPRLLMEELRISKSWMYKRLKKYDIQRSE